MAYLVLEGAAYDLFAEAIRGHGCTPYRDVEDIEFDDPDAPFTSVRIVNHETVSAHLEHPDGPAAERYIELPWPTAANGGLDRLAKSIVEFASTTG